MEWIAPLLAGVVSVLTAVFAWVKVRDQTRFSGIETELDRLKLQLAESKAKIDELEIQLAASEDLRRANFLAWDADRVKLLSEVNGLRATIIRMEVGTTAAIITINKNSIIIDANSMVIELFGWTKEELINQHLRVLVPFRYRQRHAVAVADLMAGKKPLRTEELRTTALSRTGQEVPVTIALTAWEDGGEPIYGAELRRRVS